MTTKEANTNPVRVWNDWRPETLDLLLALVADGFEMSSGDNGEEWFKFSDMDTFIANLIACDEAKLYVRKGTKRLALFLVLGNSPGEIVADCVCHPDLERVIDAHYNKWEGREQPTLTHS